MGLWDKPQTPHYVISHYRKGTFEPTVEKFTLFYESTRHCSISTLPILYTCVTHLNQLFWSHVSSARTMHWLSTLLLSATQTHPPSPVKCVCMYVCEHLYWHTEDFTCTHIRISHMQNTKQKSSFSLQNYVLLHFFRSASPYKYFTVSKLNSHMGNNMQPLLQ